MDGIICHKFYLFRIVPSRIEIHNRWPRSDGHEFIWHFLSIPSFECVRTIRPHSKWTTASKKRRRWIFLFSLIFRVSIWILRWIFEIFYSLSQIQKRRKKLRTRICRRCRRLCGNLKDEFYRHHEIVFSQPPIRLDNLRKKIGRLWWRRRGSRMLAIIFWENLIGPIKGITQREK